MTCNAVHTGGPWSPEESQWLPHQLPGHSCGLPHGKMVFQRVSAIEVGQYLSRLLPRLNAIVRDHKQGNNGAPPQRVLCVVLGQNRRLIPMSGEHAHNFKIWGTPITPLNIFVDPATGSWHSNPAIILSVKKSIVRRTTTCVHTWA